MLHRNLSRRQFLQATAMTTVGMALAACQPATAPAAGGQPSAGSAQKEVRIMLSS